ncbi:VOLTAGE-DEPENDENT L-TYPE CALCIUM CHANNEL SUBUNIT [Salix koriyanagi]|uniref:VOLTAGE-DEPENDENT L-TYPE CALCIUM CHANNEL SUBUNIT n=1 Tax=Salix koriyanagi TaxID=2511006 RepID=A0A9Q0UYA7_9ROSI|nr:VOLTAGE-DEPENDENT L-TYPE CALCIUM CHANNEL SUBUNIT [Salix koriyanagi]
MADQEPEVINGMEASKKRGDYNDQEIDLYTIIHRMIVMIVYPDPGSSASSTSLLQRIKTVLSENLPLLGEGSRNSGKKLLQWTRRGSPFKSSSCYIFSWIGRISSKDHSPEFLVILALLNLVGTIALLSMTGVIVFMLFFLAATFNAIVISLLMSLAAAGGFLALFFTILTAIYIGALSVAIVVISTAMFSATVAILVVTGWIVFFWTVWLVTKKSVGVAKHSLTLTGSAISACSSSIRSQYRYEELNKLEA